MSIVLEDFGLLPFDEARQLQNKYVESRAKGLSPDTLIICEHPPTISLGYRSRQSDLGLEAETWSQMGVSVVKTDRGGFATIHSPGQLLLYPVVSLRERKQGLMPFVSQVLECISEAVQDCNVPACARLEPVGVWTTGSGARSPKKIASAGLRLKNGITQHGFSVNITNDLSYFAYIRPCGLSSESITSLAREIGENQLELPLIKEALSSRISSRL